MVEGAMRDLHATLVCPFSHIGPGQATDSSSPLLRQAARIEEGLSPPRHLVGDLNAERDFLSTEDLVGLYVRIIEAGRALRSGDAISLACGVSHHIGDVLDTTLPAPKSSAMQFAPQQLWAKA